MPVSGRPTKAALLKMTQGSSGAEMKPFQKTRKAAGTGSEEAEMLAGNGARVARSQTITETAAARRIVRAMTSVPQRRSVRISASSLAAALFEALEVFE